MFLYCSMTALCSFTMLYLKDSSSRNIQAKRSETFYWKIGSMIALKLIRVESFVVNVSF